jgi:tetratricopeptide (TPR) repeat protein
MLRDLEVWNLNVNSTLPVGPGSASLSGQGLDAPTWIGQTAGVPIAGGPTGGAAAAAPLLQRSAAGPETVAIATPPPFTPAAPAPAPTKMRRRVVLVAFAATILCAAGGTAVWWKLKPAPRAIPASKSLSVLVADFDNTTSEPVFEGTLEPVFVTGLEDASFLAMYDRGIAHRLAKEIQPGATKVNEALARLIATREGVNVIVTGLVARQGDQYRVTVNAIDGATGKSIVSKDSAAVPKEDVLEAAAKIVPALRQALGDVPPESQKAASGETFTGASLTAVHDYAAAQDLQWAGKLDEAAALYLKASQEDPAMGRAYAGLAAVSMNLGRSADGEKYYQQALALLNHMSEREKFRTRGGYFLAMRDQQKAIEEFSALVERYPSDTAGRANLALAYLYARDMRRALEEGREAAKLYPKNALQRNNLALYALYAGDAKTGAEEARKALQINPRYEKGYVALAFAALLDGDAAKANQMYESLRSLSPRGASLAIAGLADAAQYAGHYSASLKLLDDNAAVNSAAPRSLSAANKLILAAEARLARGDAGQAVRLASEAMKLNDSESISVLAARIMTRARREGEARQIASRLRQSLAAEPKAYSHMIEADILLQQGKASAAMDELQESKRLTDTWLAHFDLARVYISAGAFAQAHSELDTCERRRGEALALFLDEMPTSRYLSMLPYYLGRAQEGLKIRAAAGSYKTFLAMRQNGDDPLASDARKRLQRLEK